MAIHVSPSRISGIKEIQSTDSPFRPQKNASGTLSEMAKLSYSLRKIILEGQGLDPECWEAQISRTLVNETPNLQAYGIRVPLLEVFSRDLSLTGSGGTMGGLALVENKLRETADTLRPFSACVAAGATVLNGLKANVSWPRLATSTTPSFLAESATSTGTTAAPTFSLLQMTPHRLTSELNVSRQLIEQAEYDVEKFISNMLLKDIASLIDFAAINGTGTAPQPTGILAMAENTALTSDYGKLAVGTTFGGAPTWASIVGMETAVFNQDVTYDGTMSWVISPTTREKLMLTQKGTSPEFIMADEKIGGFRAFTTTNLATTNQAIFGRFSDLVIGVWGIDILSDPYFYLSSGLIKVVINAWIDVGMIHGPGICRSEDSAAQ
jgi:HK97 family phage major capsid protein